MAASRWEGLQETLWRVVWWKSLQQPCRTGHRTWILRVATSICSIELSIKEYVSFMSHTFALEQKTPCDGLSILRLPKLGHERLSACRRSFHLRRQVVPAYSEAQHCTCRHFVYLCCAPLPLCWSTNVSEPRINEIVWWCKTYLFHCKPLPSQSLPDCW